MNKLFTFTAGVVLGIVLAGASHTKAEKNEEIHILNDVEYANYRTLDYKIQMIEAYSTYYQEVEKLLTEISIYYNWYDDEPSAYYEARDKLEYLWSLEDDDNPYVNKENVINK